MNSQTFLRIGDLCALCGQILSAPDSKFGPPPLASISVHQRFFLPPSHFRISRLPPAFGEREISNKIAARWKIPPTDLPYIYRRCDGHNAWQPAGRLSPCGRPNRKAAICNYMKPETTEKSRCSPSVPSRGQGQTVDSAGRERQKVAPHPQSNTPASPHRLPWIVAYFEHVFRQLQRNHLRSNRFRHELETT
jgi:hypothetical protein